MDKDKFFENKIKKIINIMFSADGGCEFCVSELSAKLIKEFPEYEEFVRKKFKDEFGREIEEIDKR